MLGKKELPFGKYKQYLIDYLRMQGVEAREGQVMNCPWHEDSTPSFSVFRGESGELAFNCFGCGRAGDIYKAVEYCTGETDAKKQFEEVERIFGNGESVVSTFVPASSEKEEPTFTPDPEAFKKLTDWLKTQTTDERIRHYFSQRMRDKTLGQSDSYPEEVLKNAVPFFYYWPGARIAEGALGKKTLFDAGIPFSNKDKDLPEEQRRVSWYHDGILAKSKEGFKLLYIDTRQEKPSQKRNPRQGVSYFPIPDDFPEGETVVLMEGEIDAILCHAIGIKAYSMGGVGGLTKKRIEKYIVGKDIPEIILFADNDKNLGSQKKYGLVPVTKDDHIRETVPENLIKLGYKGKIKVTVLPADCPYKDPDDAIRNRDYEIVRKAVREAKDYVRPLPLSQGAGDNGEKEEAKNADGGIFEKWDEIPLKFFKSLIKKFPYDEMENEDKIRLFSAAYKSCRDSRAIEALVEWSGNTISKSDIKQFAKDGPSPYDLEPLGVKYNVSAFIINKLMAMLVPASEILENNKIKKTIISIDYSTVQEETIKVFLDDKSEHTAAEIISQASCGNLMYHPVDKNNYAFNGINWMSVEGLAEPICQILSNILIDYLKRNTQLKEAIGAMLKRIRSRQFRQNVVKDFNEMPENIFDTNIVKFDAEPCKESYTFLDGVVYFRNGKIEYKREADRTEYRRGVLPYTIDEFKKAAEPKKFLDFINSDFYEPDEKTLALNPHRTADSLLYALSLIPSRNKKECYGMFFLGEGGTGKSTLCNLLEDLFIGFSYSIPKGLLVAQRAPFENPASATPQLAEFEGKLLAISQETRKGSLLISDVFKSITSGDTMSARFLHENLRRFNPTSQIIVASNYDPRFDGHDGAVVRRLLVFRFNINHRKNKDDARFADIKAYLRDEYPAILKLFAQKYIELQAKFGGKVPESQECINEKNNYVEDQETDTDNFVKLCLKITNYDNDSFVFSDQIYACYLRFLDRDESEQNSKDILTQKKLTGILKRDYQEFKANWKQKRPAGGGLPKWGFQHISFTELGLEYLSGRTAQNTGVQVSHNGPVTACTPPPDDNPFAEYPG